MQTPAENRKSQRFTFLHPLGRITWIMTAAYGISATMQILSSWLIGERWLLNAFCNSFAHLLWLPALILLPFSILFRAWRLVIVLIPVVFAFIINYGAQLLPRSGTVQAGTHSFSLMTFNIQARTTDFEDIAMLIRAGDADIVAIQELSFEGEAALHELLRDDYPHQALYSSENPHLGQALFSRFPIEDHSYWQHDVPNALGHQRAQINTPRGSLIIYNVHPVHPFMVPGTFFDSRHRTQEIAILLERIEAETLPALMVGDFNMPDLTEDYYLLSSNLNDAFRRAGSGMGWTYPDWSDPATPRTGPLTSLTAYLNTPPLLRLDYVFYNEGLQAVEARVWPYSAGSDHRPLWVRLNWRR